MLQSITLEIWKNLTSIMERCDVMVIRLTIPKQVDYPSSWI